MTVSLALRYQAGVSERTRERILKLAKEMGYHPDAMLSSLSAYRRSIKPVNYTGTIAWLTMGESRNAWKHGWRGILEMYDGALEQAGKLGYKLESFWLDEPNMTHERLSAILRSRNIQGVVILAHPGPGIKLYLNWPALSCVCLCHSLAEPHLHALNDDSFYGMAYAVQQLADRGFRRIGLHLSDVAHERVLSSWKGSYYTTTRDYGLMDHVPILTLARGQKSDFLKWYHQHQPEAVVSYAADACIEWFKSEGIQVPRDVSVVSIGVEGEPEISGIKQACFAIGQGSVDKLIGMIRSGEVGIPKAPMNILIEGHWNEGKSIGWPKGKEGAPREASGPK